MPVARWGFGVYRYSEAVLHFNVTAEPVGYEQGGGIGGVEGGDGSTYKGFRNTVKLGTVCALRGLSRH